MLILTIASIAIFLVILIIFIKYKNKKGDSKPQEKETEAKVETKHLPQCNYPLFSHVRLIEMGLSDKEAKEFVAELIPQLELQIPLIKESIDQKDFKKMEGLLHSIKGSASNIGTGGISALLVEFNDYIRTGTDIDIVQTYFKHLLRYTAKLKEQYR